mgnify:FL=1|jgi:hypothetical protein
MGSLDAIPGSHATPIHNHFDADGNWAGAPSDEEIAELDLGQAEWMKARVGTITIHNIRALHGPRPNNSPRSRSLLWNSYASADAFSLTPYPGSACARNETLISGKRARIARFEMDECRRTARRDTGRSSLFNRRKTKACEPPSNAVPCLNTSGSSLSGMAARMPLEVIEAELKMR